MGRLIKVKKGMYNSIGIDYMRLAIKIIRVWKRTMIKSESKLYIEYKTLKAQLECLVKGKESKVVNKTTNTLMVPLSVVCL